MKVGIYPEYSVAIPNSHMNVLIRIDGGEVKKDPSLLEIGFIIDSKKFKNPLKSFIRKLDINDVFHVMYSHDDIDTNLTKTKYSLKNIGKCNYTECIKIMNKTFNCDDGRRRVIFVLTDDKIKGKNYQDEYMVFEYPHKKFKLFQKASLLKSLRKYHICDANITTIPNIIVKGYNKKITIREGDTSYIYIVVNVIQDGCTICIGDKKYKCDFIMSTTPMRNDCNEWKYYEDLYKLSLGNDLMHDYNIRMLKKLMKIDKYGFIRDIYNDIK